MHRTAYIIGIDNNEDLLNCLKQMKVANEKPMGVAEYELVRALPEPLDRSLPSIEEIEAELSRELGELEGGE